jgi:hypothetical protein
MRARASSFKSEYPLLSPRSSSNCLRLLPRLLVTSIPLHPTRNLFYSFITMHTCWCSNVLQKDSAKVRIHLPAEPVIQPLVNQICVVKTWSRAPNEPLFNRSYGSADSRFFSTNTKGWSVQVGTASWRDLVCTAVCEHLANCGAMDGRWVIATDRRILLSKFTKSVGDILVKFLYCPQMYRDFMSNINSDPDRFLFTSVRQQRRVFLFLLFKLAIIKAAQLTTTTAKFS